VLQCGVSVLWRRGTVRMPSRHGSSAGRRSAHAKVDKILGLETKMEESTTGVQKEGWLSRLPQNSFAWKKCYCIVKDGFLLYYTSRSDRRTFDTKPKGVLPLDGAVITLLNSARSQFRCTHPAIPGASFKLRAENDGEALAWISALESAKKATWENALLGNALIEKMKTKGTKLEEENEKAFQVLQEKAQRLAKEFEQAENIAKRDKQLRERFQAKLKAAKEKRLELEGKRSLIQSELSREVVERRKASEKRASVARKLDSAKQALSQLEEALAVMTGKDTTKSFEDEADGESVEASVEALKAFFEARAREQAIRAKALERKPSAAFGDV